MSTLEEKIQLLEQQISNERQKLSADRMDISFGEIMNLYEQSELIIRPEYQRLFRWTNTQKTLLIESILMGDLDEIIDALVSTEQARLLKEAAEEVE